MRLQRRLRIALVVALLAGIAAFAINASVALGLLYPDAARTVAQLPPAAPYQATDRVLIVAPHPDDEVLCCAGSVMQAQAAGAQVFIVWLTSGDGFEFDAIYLDRELNPEGEDLEALGRRRIREALDAARVLQVPRDHLFFLGYPDGGLLRLFLQNYAAPLRSRYTGLTNVPYGLAERPGAAYTGQNLERDLTSVIERVRPTLVLAPSPQDQHPDHRAASFLVTRTLAERGELGKLRLWIVHGGLEWPLPKGLHKNLPLLVPPRGRTLAWERLDLTGEQVARKLDAIRAHKSQMALLQRFMLAFARENELLTRQILPELRR